MEFDFTVHGLASQTVTVWDAQALKRLSQDDYDNIKKVVDSFGKRSAKAQGLNAPVTDIYRLRATDQRLYLAATRHSGTTTVLGALKTGRKKLFVRDVEGALKEVEPCCVLDFYVHESVQRRGVGKDLFEAFLATEQLQPAAVAYDRPSEKLLAFLSKHYGLTDYLAQNNNFVLFNAFWKVFQPQPPAAAASQLAARGTSCSRRAVQLQPVAATALPQALADPPQTTPAVPMPAWVAGLPPASRPQMWPSTAILPPSLGNSPGNTSVLSATLHQHEAAPPYQHQPYMPSRMGLAAQPPSFWGAPYDAALPLHLHADTALPVLAPSASFGRRAPSSGAQVPPPHLTPQGLGAAGAAEVVSLPAHRGSGDALDRFHTQQQQPHHQDPPVPWQQQQEQQRVATAAGSVHTPQGPAHLYRSVAVPAASVTNYTGTVRGCLAAAQQAAGSAHSMPSSAPRYTVPPWGVDDVAYPLHLHQGAVPISAVAARAARDPHWAVPPQRLMMGGASSPVLPGSGPSTPPHQAGQLLGAGTRSGGGAGGKVQPGSGAGGTVSAREVALAARAGSGAAGCLVW